MHISKSQKTIDDEKFRRIKSTFQRNAAAAKREEQEQKSLDPVLVEEVKTRFTNFVEEKEGILDQAFEKKSEPNPVFLNPDLLNDLIHMDPDAALAFVRQRPVNPIHKAIVRKMEEVLRTVFSIKPEMINQGNFDYICTISGNNLDRIEVEPRLLEELSFEHPELAKANSYLQHIDFTPELKSKIDKQRLWMKARGSMLQDGVDDLFPASNSGPSLKL